MIDISVAIVAYNDEEDVRNAVCSIVEHTAASVSMKIYVIDNSTEENNLQALEQEFAQVEYVKTGKNLGFGAGHNYVMERLDSKFHAVVNPDILLVEDSLSILMDFMDRMKAGMAVPRLLDTEGNLQAVYRRELTVLDMGIRMFFPTHFKKRQAYHTMQDMDYEKPFKMLCVQGSFFVIRTKMFRQLCGFDERYFMYMEDADLCRFVSVVSDLWYCPDTKVIHRWERGSHKDPKLRKIHIRSMLKYFCKWGWRLW